VSKIYKRAGGVHVDNFGLQNGAGLIKVPIKINTGLVSLQLLVYQSLTFHPLNHGHPIIMANDQSWHELTLDIMRVLTKQIYR
jgi:hypothetical protein